MYYAGILYVLKHDFQNYFLHLVRRLCCFHSWTYEYWITRYYAHRVNCSFVFFQANCCRSIHTSVVMLLKSNSNIIVALCLNTMWRTAWILYTIVQRIRWLLSVRPTSLDLYIVLRNKCSMSFRLVAKMFNHNDNVHD